MQWEFCSIIIFHLNKLWNGKFLILCDVLFLARLLEKFDIDHLYFHAGWISWREFNWYGVCCYFSFILFSLLTGSPLRFSGKQRAGSPAPTHASHSSSPRAKRRACGQATFCSVVYFLQHLGGRRGRGSVRSYTRCRHFCRSLCTKTLERGVMRQICLPFYWSLDRLSVMLPCL